MKFFHKTLLLLPLILLGCNNSDMHQIEVMKNEIHQLKAQNDSLHVLLNKKMPDSNYWFNPHYDGRKFTRLGIDNPDEFIKNALREKPELIPTDAVLGGTMYFGNIQLLSDKWLIAEFEDGHIYGRAIFRYKLNKENTPEFKLLEFDVPGA